MQMLVILFGDMSMSFIGLLISLKSWILWFLTSSRDHRHMTIHSDSTSAIARAGHTSTGPVQSIARNIRNMVCELRSQGKTVDLVWIKGHQGTPGIEKADVLAGKAAEKAGYSKYMSIAHLKLRISEKFRSAKEKWHKAPGHHGSGEIPPLSQEILPRRHEERTGPHNCADPDQPLEVRSIPQADPQDGGR
jgi:hypothetical protein